MLLHWELESSEMFFHNLMRPLDGGWRNSLAVPWRGMVRDKDKMSMIQLLRLVLEGQNYLNSVETSKVTMEDL